MKLKKLALCTVSMLTVFALGACSKDDTNKKSSGKTEISMLIGKEEIANELDEAISKYNDSQDKYQVKVIPLAGQNSTEKITSLYASKNAPVLMNTGVYTELEQWKDKFLDLSDMELVTHIDKKYLEAGTVDGKVIGIPTTIEAFGFLYNQEVLDKASGGKFNPSSVKTRQDLKTLMANIEKQTEKSAVEISPMDWSLGAHYSNLLFTDQSENKDQRYAFMDQMMNGKENLMNNDVYNNWIDTFDLMKKNNMSQSSPLSSDYDAATMALANGEIGLWFMGNWAYPQLKEANPETKYGILPVPISDKVNAYGNDQISVGVPQTWAIDGEQSSKEEQDGAKDFINWLYETEEGQEYYVNKMGFIPINDNAKVEPNDELSKQILNYVKEDKTLEWMNAQYPPTAFPAMGASLQKYLSGEIDRKELAQELEDYWKTSAK
ncbi:ABC transporter substrate-binding protein [Vagococcus bubulae]|nr:ABC transporter substrate-binding protein [Vagococcus bubulae]